MLTEVEVLAIEDFQRIRNLKDPIRSNHSFLDRRCDRDQFLSGARFIDIGDDAIAKRFGVVPDAVGIECWVARHCQHVTVGHV